MGEFGRVYPDDILTPSRRGGRKGAPHALRVVDRIAQIQRKVIPQAVNFCA